MQIKLTKTEWGTLNNALEYFDIFCYHELPEEDSDLTQDDMTIDNINCELQDIYDELCETNILDMSIADMRNSIIALFVYKEIVSKDIPTSKGRLDKYQKDLALRNIEALTNNFYVTLTELGETDPIQTYEIDPNSCYI